jgi:hypothetical protein
VSEVASTTPLDWTLLMRALAEEIDAAGGANARDALLRAVGLRMAAMRPLTPAHTMDTLVMEINDMLAAIGWGSASFQLNETDRSLLISHDGLPRIGAAGDPAGTWMSAVLEGLYHGWLAQLPGNDPSLAVRRMRISPTMVLLRYARG